MSSSTSQAEARTSASHKITNSALNSRAHIEAFARQEGTFVFARHTAIMPSLKDFVPKERLEKLYVSDGLSTTQIAERLGTNRESVRKLINEYGIAMRERGYPFNKRRA